MCFSDLVAIFIDREIFYMIKQKLFQIIQFVHYFLVARYWKGHGVHSPFVYEFVREVVYGKKNRNNYQQIIKVKKGLTKNQQTIELEKMGAASAAMKTSMQKIGRIASVAGIRNKYGKLLYNIIAHYKPAKVLELGTNLGISTLWMAMASKDSKIFTIEGQQGLLNAAKDFTQKASVSNIDYIHGNFDVVLPEILDKKEFDIVFIDGNHTYEATLRYFQLLIENVPETAMLIFDDIYWSAGMKKAWCEIKADSRVVVSIDLFQFGIVLKNEKLTPGGYVVRY